MQLKLPKTKFDYPYFKTDNQVTLVINKTLYSFTPLMTPPENIRFYSSY
jgi:hypothetical protein